MSRCQHQNLLCDRYGCPDDPDWRGDMGGYRPAETGVRMKYEDEYRWIWPFPRLRFWLKTGVWCVHPVWSTWRMIDTGMRQIRWCENCDHAQIR